jgi:hypothetical protein
VHPSIGHLGISTGAREAARQLGPQIRQHPCKPSSQFRGEWIRHALSWFQALTGHLNRVPSSQSQLVQHQVLTSPTVHPNHPTCSTQTFTTQNRKPKIATRNKQTSASNWRACLMRQSRTTFRTRTPSNRRSDNGPLVSCPAVPAPFAPPFSNRAFLYVVNGDDSRAHTHTCSHALKSRRHGRSHTHNRLNLQTTPD